VAHKLMFTAPARARCFASSIVTLRGCEAGGHPLPSSARILPYVAEKKERSRNRGELLSLQGAASPSLLNHGRVGLDHVGGHTAPAKSCESGLYDDDGARGLPHPRGSRIPHSGMGYVMACAVFYEL
jgi:hypothetical protein